MLGIEPRAARAAWTVILVALAATLVWLLRRALLVCFCALLLAYLLSPLVDFIDRFVHRRVSRNLTLGAVYLLLLAVVVGAGAAIGGRIGQEASELAQGLPALLRDSQGGPRIPLPEWLEPYRESAMHSVRSYLESSAKEIMPTLTSAGRRILSALGNLIFVILVPILSFFLLKDAAAIRRAFLDQFPDGPRRQMLDDLVADIHLLLAQYMRALVLLSLITFLCFWLALSILGVPYALSLALVAGVGEFIPVAGPLIAAVSIVLVAGFSGQGGLLAIVVFVVVYRLFLDYALVPMLMSSGVALHPVAVIVGVLAGEQIAGVTGMFLSIPALAILRVIYVRIRKSRRGHAVEAMPS
jgi:predicted PurR-regulated permease PerM